MLSKLKLGLFLIILVAQCEAGIARIRFGKLSCGHRVHQATLGLAPLDAIREEIVSRYISTAWSFFDLGQRFKALSAGRFRGFYPDLKLIALIIEHAENARVGRGSAFHVGISKFWLQAVERPIKSWTVKTYYNPLELETPNALLEYEIEHTDGSKSFVYSYREGDKEFDERGRDRRELVNVFVLSNGLQAPPTVTHTVGGNPLDGPSVIDTPREPAAYLEEIAAEKSRLTERQ